MRTIHKTEGEPYISYAIHECFYHKSSDSVPHSCTEDEIAPHGESVDELKRELERMLVACTKPVLELNGDKIIEVKP